MTNNKAKRIIFLCPYPFDKAPSQRLKYEQYFPYFIANGWQITISSFISENFWKIIYKKNHYLAKIIYTIYGYFRRIRDLFRIRKFDVVYVHLWVTPLGLPVFEWLISKLSKKLIYDIDDMVFLGHSSEANKIIVKVKGTKKMILLMKKSNHVITCTPYLDQFVRQYNEKTTDISSTINTKIYIQRTDYSLNDIPILGWSGSYSTSKYLKILEPIFISLLNKGIKYQVLVIGDENFHFSDSRIPFTAIPWSRDKEVDNLNKIDIGLYPLPDEPWVYGKSGLKALQYMALGIPTIATAVGANFRIITDEENGFLIPINNLDLWEKRIIQLLNDKDLRERIGKKGRETVERFYSVEANKDKYLNILESMII
jgi:glycosyltransferase involved in cell wall biosynthesis